MDQMISEMTEQTSANITEAGTADFVGGYTTTGGVANRRFSLANIGNWILNKFKMNLGGSSQTVKSAIDSLNSKSQASVSIQIGDASATCTVYKIGRICALNFFVNSDAPFGSVSNDSIIGTLPIGFRPHASSNYPFQARDTGAWAKATYGTYFVFIATNGDIKIRGNENISAMQYINTTILFQTS